MTTSTRRGSVVEHLAFMRLAQRSPNTIRTRAYTLARVQAVVPVALPIADRRDLAAWQQVRTGQIAASALRAEITHLRSYYAWLVDTEIRADDPSRALLMPRAPRRVPRPMPEENFAHALACAHGDPQMTAILTLAGVGGLRCCGIAGLDWSEVNLGRRPTITIVEKGGHTRVIPIDPSGLLIPALRALPHRAGPVIPRLDGRRGHNEAHSISHRGNRFLHRNGIPETMHSLRHRCATVGYEGTHDIVAVRDYLGHASTQTSSDYTKAATASILAFAEAVGQVAS